MISYNYHNLHEIMQLKENLDEREMLYRCYC
jgi:hypothetical protein